MIIYGINPVLEALRAGRVSELRIGEKNGARLRDLLSLAGARSVPVRRVSAEALDRDSRRGVHQGVVAQVEWTNPHVWVEVDVPQDDGTSVRWGIEFTSVVHLTRRGMTMNTVKFGDEVEFTLSPYADGSPGGRFFTVKLPNGQYYCDVGAAQNVCQENN